MLEQRQCSYCKKFKSVSEFYKQGDRFESLCKTCKKISRKKRSDENAKFQKNTDSQSFLPTPSQKPIPQRIEMPIYDESILFPAEARKSLAISDDDMEIVMVFFSWHLEQNNKRTKNKES